jgi:hypothetical protein
MVLLAMVFQRNERTHICNCDIIEFLLDVRKVYLLFMPLACGIVVMGRLLCSAIVQDSTPNSCDCCQLDLGILT